MASFEVRTTEAPSKLSYQVSQQRCYFSVFKVFLLPLFLRLITELKHLPLNGYTNYQLLSLPVPQVVSKGNIILSESVSNVASTTTTILTLELTHEMAPQARLIVSYIRDENFEVVLDSININVDGAFQNEVRYF